MQRNGFSPIIIIVVGAILIALGFYFFKDIFFQFSNKTTSEQNSFYEEDIVDGGEMLKVRKEAAVRVPKVEGKIAFVKDDNIWVAEDGGAFPITNDATESFSPTFDYYLRYGHPVWSVNGSMLAFVQNFNQFFNKNNKILFYDGTYVSTSGFNSMSLTGYSHQPYWFSDEDYIRYYYSHYQEQVSTVDDKGIISAEKIGKYFRGKFERQDLHFPYLTTGLDGCGGGGSPLWAGALSSNHLATSRAKTTLFYIQSKQTAVFSVGCDNATVMTVSKSNGTDKLFHQPKSYDEGKWSLEQLVPHSLSLSTDEKHIAGIMAQELYLFDTDGNVLKQLTNSQMAYGPIFGKDNNSVYFAANYGKNPRLMKTDLLGNTTQLFEAKKLGAISNIGLNSDGSKILFTLIEQIGDEFDYENGYVKQDLYLINTDGSGLQLFLEDAKQGNWGK